MSRAAALFVAVLTFGGLLANGASAQDAAAVARARSLFDEARTAFDARRYPEARALLEESLALAPRVPTSVNLARVLRSMGELLEAERLVTRTLAGEHGEIDRERRGELESLAETLRDEIPVLSIRVEGRDEAIVTIDGVEAGEARATTPLEQRVNPSRHVVSAASRDGVEARASVSLRPHERRTISLTLADAPITAETEDLDDAEERPLVASPWLWLVVGLAVAGGATAAIILATMDRTADPIGDPVFPTAEVLRF